MKKALSIFLILVAVSYSCMWWKLSKDGVTALVKEVGVQYEGIKRKGFPLYVPVEIKIPKSDFTEQSLQGNLRSGTDYFTRKGWIRLDGAWSSDMHIKESLIFSN